MTNAVNTVGLTQSAPQQAAPAGSVVSAAAAGAPIASSLKPLIRSSDTPISPRIVVDPLAGVITQFLNGTGQVQSQIPSSAVVAYLRAGLNANGEAKTLPDQAPKSNAEDSVVA